MFLIFILGTAGSGKSELTHVFTRWMEMQGENALAVNLDPGAITIPYSGEGEVIIYLFDSALCRDPLNYVMNMFLVSAINSRFMLPQISVLSKADILGDELEEIEGWAEEPLNLKEAIDNRLSGMNRLMSQDMMDVIDRLGVEYDPIPFSTRTNLGFNRLYSTVTQVFNGGESFTT